MTLPRVRYKRKLIIFDYSLSSSCMSPRTRLVPSSIFALLVPNCIARLALLATSSRPSSLAASRCNSLSPDRLWTAEDVAGCGRVGGTGTNRGSTLRCTGILES